MLIPTEKISTASLQTAKPNSLHLSVDRNATLFWIIPVADGAAAIFLSGDYAGHGFKVGQGADWAGASLGSVEVRVDPGSANSGEGTVSWQLKAAKGALAAPMTVKPQGFNETVWMPIAEIQTTENLTVYYSRWSIGIRVDEEWHELVTVSDGNVSGQLVPAAAE